MKDFIDSEIEQTAGLFSVGYRSRLGKYCLFHNKERVAECWDFQKTYKGDIRVWLKKFAKTQQNRVDKINDLMCDLEMEKECRNNTLQRIGEIFGT